jgi:hypothetical protein
MCGLYSRKCGIRTTFPLNNTGQKMNVKMEQLNKTFQPHSWKTLEVDQHMWILCIQMTPVFVSMQNHFTVDSFRGHFASIYSIWQNSFVLKVQPGI